MILKLYYAMTCEQSSQEKLGRSQRTEIVTKTLFKYEHLKKIGKSQKDGELNHESSHTEYLCIVDQNENQVAVYVYENFQCCFCMGTVDGV